MKTNTNRGFSEHRLRDAVDREKKFGNWERQKGTGQKITVRTDGVLETASAFRKQNSEQAECFCMKTWD